MQFAQAVGAIGAQGAIDQEEMVDELEDVFDVRNKNLTVRKDNPMEESRLLNAGVFIAAKLSEDHAKHLEIHDQESNGNAENRVHKLEHQMFQKQLEQNQQAEQNVSVPGGPTSGLSFLQNLLGGQLPAQPEQAPNEAPQTGGVTPPGVV